MRTDGSAERWLMLVSAAILAAVVTILLGGPAEALETLERLAQQGWDAVASLLRR